MSGIDGNAQGRLMNLIFQNNLNPISRKSFDPLTTESVATQSPLVSDDAESLLFGFSPKQANYDLESGWKSFAQPESNADEEVSGTGRSAVSDKMVGEDEGGFDGAGAPYRMNRADNVENRELKMSYAGLNTVFGSLKPDPTKYDKITYSYGKDGSVTFREETKDGKWREVTRSADGQHVVLKDEAGVMSKHGSTLGFESSSGDLKDVYTQDANGQLKNVRTQNGVTKTKIAQADGGYRELDGNGNVTKASAADPNMARFEGMADRMGTTVGPDGIPRKLTDEQRYQLGADLARFDPATLKNLEESGVQIRLYDSENPPPGGYPGGRAQWKPGSGGYYVHNDKTIVLKQSNFRNGGNGRSIDITHHEMGHAVDDMLASDMGRKPILATQKDPYLQELYQDYKDRAGADESKEWSAYATTSPEEYFAEGVSMYLGGDKQKQKLLEKDPKLYGYVGQMLNKSRDRSLPYRQQMTNYSPFGSMPSYYTNPGGPFSVSNIPRNNYTAMQPQQQTQYLLLMMMLMMQQMMMMMMAMSMGGSPFMPRM